MARRYTAYYQASHCNKIFVSTPKIFKFKDKLTSAYNYCLQNNTKCTKLHFADWINRSGSPGQGRQSLGQQQVLPMVTNSDVDGHLAFDWFIHLTRKVSALVCKQQFLRNLTANFCF